MRTVREIFDGGFGLSLRTIIKNHINILLYYQFLEESLIEYILAIINESSDAIWREIYQNFFEVDQVKASFLDSKPFKLDGLILIADNENKIINMISITKNGNKYEIFRSDSK